MTNTRILKYISTLRSGLNYVEVASKNAVFWKQSAWVFNVAKWKRPLLRNYLSDYKLHYLALKDDVYLKERTILLSNKPVFIVWGCTLPPNLQEFADEHGIQIQHIEDGFFRSIGLGAKHILPYSICHDKTGLYYDSSRPSDLENILNNYDFNNNKNLMDEARRCLSEVKAKKLSKYNESCTDIATFLYGPKVRKRILVIGQVEDDQSLLYGCEKIMSNVDLIKLAHAENPDAQIIYKPHPDVMAGLRKEISNTSQVAHLVEIIRMPLALADALTGVDQLYTLTSLAGFEALLHGVAVTTLGAPFYSGWGLTDDRQITGRRGRVLSVEEIFAAAYIVYPMYIDPKLKKRSSLGDVINIFNEKLSEIEVITPLKATQRMKAYNFSTQHSVDSRFLCKSTAKDIAIITDSAEALLIARGMAAHGKRVTVITTRDALANDDSMLLSPEEQESIQITSIHKRYSVPMSQIEELSVDLTQTFSDSLRMALTEIASSHLSADVITALCQGLEDYIYFEALRFYGVRECIDEFDQTVLIIRDAAMHQDTIKSYYFHGKSNNKLGNIYLSLLSGDTQRQMEILAKSAPVGFQELQHLAELKSEFSRLWWSIQDPAYDDYISQGKHIAICGNIANKNYAYSPASLKLLESVGSASHLPVLFFNTGLLSSIAQEETKSITLSENFGKLCTVYNGHIARYQKKYPSEVLSKASLFEGPLCERLISLARQRLPDGFLEIFRPRLEKYTASIFSHIIFISESTRTMSRAALFATSMDRTYISRILSAIAQSQNIPSIGIQPQFLSASRRYKPPAVDLMGAIDSSQVEIYARLGAKKGTVRAIGSVNIIQRLSSMASASSNYGKEPDKKTLFFAMQHSTSFEMLETANALKDICKRLGYTLIVKPHPHQEIPILNAIKSIYSDCPNVRVMSRESDTYEALVRCSIVIGLFSGVLMEAAIYGTKVIVSSFNELDESIDFSKRGLAIKTRNSIELEQAISDLSEDGPLSQSLRVSREEYLKNNPQYYPPYTTSYLDEFITASIKE
jgi:capsular polysaccharide export protein